MYVLGLCTLSYRYVTLFYTAHIHAHLNGVSQYNTTAMDPALWHNFLRSHWQNFIPLDNLMVHVPNHTYSIQIVSKVLWLNEWTNHWFSHEPTLFWLAIFNETFHSSICNTIKTVNYKEVPIGALVSQTCVLHSYTVPLQICHTNSGRLFCSLLYAKVSWFRSWLFTRPIYLFTHIFKIIKSLKN